MPREGFPQLSSFRRHVWEEFNRRSNDFGFSYPKDPEKRQSDLKGPRSIWIRATSNAIVTVNNKTYEGLVLQAGTDISDMYGLDGPVSRGSLLGFDVHGNKLYTRTNDKRYRPGPSIQNLSVTYAGSFGTLKRGRLEWTCHTREQLEILEKFFLNPGITVLVEYGWSNVLGNYTLPLVDLGSKARFNDEGERIRNGYGMLGAWTNRDIVTEKIVDTKGNYDAVLGWITNFDWTQDSSGIYNCTTEISTQGETMIALSSDNKQKTTREQDQAGPRTFKEFFTNHMDRVMANDDDPRVFQHQARKIVIDTSEIHDVVGVDRPRAHPEQQDWMFITWGYLEDLINEFYREVMITNNGSDIEVFEIDSSDVLISAHPNLISTNGSVLIIPNPSAPVYSSQGEIKDKVNLSIDRINFPPTAAGENKYQGNIRNLFINVNAIKRALSKEPFKAFLNSLLREMSRAACDLWDFQIRNKQNRENVLEVVDLNYVGTPVNKFVGRATSDISQAPQSENDTTSVPYLFRIDQARTIVRDLNIESDLPSELISTIVFGRGQSEDSVGEGVELPEDRDVYGDNQDIISKVYTIEFEGDRLLKRLDPQSKTERTQDDREPTPSYDPQDYWPIRDDSSGKIKSYVYPDYEVVNSYLYEDESRPENNRNNNVLIPLRANVTIDGISGIRIGDCFMVDSIPNRYQRIGIFQVVDVAEDISLDGWTTRIEGQLRVGNL